MGIADWFSNLLGGAAAAVPVQESALPAFDMADPDLNLPGNQNAQNWRRLTPESADWDAMGAPHFYLFTLKALSFITLRRGDLAGAQEKLAKLRDLDPNNNVGWGTIALLAERVASEGE